MFYLWKEGMSVNCECEFANVCYTHQRPYRVLSNEKFTVKHICPLFCNIIKMMNLSSIL